MPEWQRRLLMGSTALRAPDDDGAGGNQDQDDDDDGLDPPDEGGDDDSDDDLSDANDDGDDDASDEPAPRQSRSRGDRDYGSLRAGNRELTRQLEERDRRLADLEARVTGAQTHAQQAAEQVRVAAMEPWEREQHEARQREDRRDREIHELRVQTWDSNDRADFRAQCVEDPAFAKIKDEVEKVFKQQMTAGKPTPRETIATFLLGQKVRERAKRAGNKTERRASETRQQQRARPGSARSDVRDSGGGSKTERQARDKRLDGMKI